MMPILPRKRPHLLSVQDLSLSEINVIFSAAKKYSGDAMLGRSTQTLQGCIVATLFFQASTRTRLSFESAVCRLGGDVIGFADAEVSRAGTSWFEGLTDTAKVVGNYADAVIIRHPEVAAVRTFAEASPIPVINAGNGDGTGSEHPTQALVDLYTILELTGRIEGVTVLISGHLTQRTAHSLLLCLAKFKNVKVFLFNGNSPRLSSEEEISLRDLGLDFEYVATITEKLSEVDILYTPGIKEDATHVVPEDFIITEAELVRANPHIRVMHPLPRGGELLTSFDHSPLAAYFQQAANGVPVRMALLESILGRNAPWSPTHSASATSGLVNA